jgi:hypothetical protein
VSKRVLGDNYRGEERDVHQMGIRGETLWFWGVVSPSQAIRFFWKKVHL